MCGVCDLQSTQDGVNTCVVSSCRFGGAASFFVGDVVVRLQDTSRTRLQVIGPSVRDMRVAQVFDSRSLLPGSLEEECDLRAPQSSPVR